ncbi:M56 family metallopeptidase [Sulfolobus tengchongensis]|uniref:M56 family metallopeptidase n=1 Tax=Sulfolobus tengchongensis TaxID=207809 RepID=A0AAX4L3L5_9CREN
MQSITTYWWKYYFVSFFSILVIDLLVSTLNVNVPYFFLIQIGLVFGLWYLISPFIMMLTFKMRRAPQDLTLIVKNISSKFKVKMPNVYVIEDNFLNAFAFGNVVFRGVAITLSLYNTLSQEELIAVLSHEVAHIRNYDPEIMLVTIIAMNSLYAGFLSFLPFMYLPVLLIFYFVLLFPLVFNVHRVIEKRADLTAISIDPNLTYWLESSLIKIGYLSRSIPLSMLRYVPPIQVLLAKQFIINNTVDRKGFFSFATHPSLKERLLYLSEHEQQKTYYL